MIGAGVRLEEAGDADGVLLLLLDTDVHGLDAPQQQPRVEGAEAGTLGVLEEVDLYTAVKKKTFNTTGHETREGFSLCVATHKPKH